METEKMETEKMETEKMETEKPAEKEKPKRKPKLVKMIRERDGKKADVHPDMIAHYTTGGFKRV